MYKKYLKRPSPPYPAQDYCHQEKVGNDGNMYLSFPDKNNICKWKKLKDSFSKRKSRKVSSSPKKKYRKISKRKSVFKFRKSSRASRKSSRVSRKSSRESRKSSRSSRKSERSSKVSRKSSRSSKVSRKSSRASRKSSRASRKSSRVSRKSSRVSRKSSRVSRKSSRSSKVLRKTFLNSKKCQDFLSEKIVENMKEYKEGKYVSRKQALAVSYSQVKKKYPECSEFLKK
jgi:hypothetical protein